mmetsp:Transcript_29900/g.69747  ORF Transcript_29900/g.69747 Transcript_29900/m.69747 type:complete len:279 (-) Transcript_29900:398-1234(-)
MSVVNLARWPIRDLSSAACSSIVATAQKSLAATGCASFPAFLRGDALLSAAAEARALSAQAYVTDAHHNAYQLADEPALPTTHVRNLQMHTRVASTAFDELGGQSALRQLYEWDGLLDFLGALLGRPCYRLDDPLGCCSINVFRPGWEHAWHFDEAETTVTLCLQAAEGGGEFEYTPPLRDSSGELAARAVTAILDGHSQYSPSAPDEGSSSSEDLPPVSVASFEPGTLQVFNGRYSLHRVAPVQGKLDRLVAVLCFSAEPGVRNSTHVQEMFWGRRA